MKRPVQHETDAAGQRLLREVFEGFGWVVNAIENDYGADYEIEIFARMRPESCGNCVDGVIAC